MGEAIACYLRLSVEDDNVVDESNSIKNQRQLIDNYLDEHEELQHLQRFEYVDDGYSGKNFNRPSIKKMLQDIKERKIKCIVVKDFSRFGRSHIEVGNYIEKIFPFMGVRFISINNNFDSVDYIGTTPDIDVPFQNLIYDYYSEENSMKIKANFKEKKRSGQFMAVYAAYGYVKDPLNKNHLIIDKEAAMVVEKIFRMYLECGNKAEIARCLNEDDILIPAEYMKSKGIDYKWKYQGSQGLWTGAIVGRILKNQIYVGDLVCSRVEVVETGGKDVRRKPKDEWIVVSDTHEGIISREMFREVQEYKKVLKGKDDKHKKGSVDSPIKGYVKCGGCRHNMIRRARKVAVYYCRYYYELKNLHCCSINIKEDDLIEIVLSGIQNQAKLAKGLGILYDEKQQKVAEDKRRNELEVKNLSKQVTKYKQEIFEAYKDYREERLSKEQYVGVKERNSKLVEGIEEKILLMETKEKGEVDSVESSFLSEFNGKDTISSLTRDVVEQLVEGIYVYDGDRVEIVFRYRDEFKSLVRELEG